MLFVFHDEHINIYGLGLVLVFADTLDKAYNAISEQKRILLPLVYQRFTLRFSLEVPDLKDMTKYLKRE